MKKPDLPPPPSPDSGAGDPLDSLFEQARGEGLGAREMSALWARVAVGSAGGPGHAGGEPGGAAGGAPAVAAGAAGKTVAAWLLGGGLVAAVATGAAYRWTSSRAPLSTPVGVAAPAQQGAPVAAPSRVERSYASPGPVESPASAVLAPPPVDRVRIAPRLRSATLAEGRAPATAVAVTQQSQASAPQSAKPTPDDVASAPADAAPSEAALLLRARRALGSDPAAALAMTDEHARRFPAGTLAPEREVLAIEALARLGRSSEARRRLDALRERYPNAANVARLEGLLGR